MIRTLLTCYVLFASPQLSPAEPLVLTRKLHHLRSTTDREWAEFPVGAESAKLIRTFRVEEGTILRALSLRQQDVKQTWTIRLNGKELGRLRQDENDMVVYYPIDAKLIRVGENTLAIEQSVRGKPKADDIRVGELTLHSRSVESLLDECSLEVRVTEVPTKQPLPCRITVLNSNGALQSVGAKSNEHLAVRPGTVYTSTGEAKFGLPPGEYTIYAGRGFEYSLASTKITLTKGDSLTRKLRISHDVPTEGYVACDTHVHTRTHSGHGDSTVQERMITLAAEGIELPIATDHNVHIDHRPFAKSMKVSPYFTPVVGNEVTTKVGHFNIFPVRAGAKIPDYKPTDWPTLFDNIFRTPDVKVCILNHARDLHSGVRPFGPKWHNALVGHNLDERKLRANAMEVINSAAIQTDSMQLFHDWMNLLNRGHHLTPVGSSDSHDVARHFVGQGRTYICCDDRDPGDIPVEQAVSNFLQGRVMVSYGLAVELQVESRYSSGELVPLTNDKVRVSASVLGPHWSRADRIVLYSNGKKIREEKIGDELRDLPSGVKWNGVWVLDRPKHDVHLVAIGSGPGIDGLYWKTAKPYQPTSTKWTPRVLGCSGAVWLDGDENGRRTPAYDYAVRLVAKSSGDLGKLLESLAPFDRAVSEQAASLVPGGLETLFSDEAEKALDKAAPHVRAGFHAYRQSQRECEIARTRD